MTARIADLGIGNLRSIRRALEHVGVDARIVEPEALLDGELVVLPGVGAFDAAIDALDPVLGELRDALLDGQPCIGICLGLQVLFERSQEGDRPGLGVFEGVVERFPTGLKVPHMGWSPVAFDDGDEDYMYFAHSYHPVPADDGDVVATCDYGGRFAAAVAKQRTVGFQFHPEKSGDAGLALLEATVDDLGVSA